MAPFTRLQAGLVENYNCYADCPSTKVTNCLREVFGIQPDPALLKYKLHVGRRPWTLRVPGRIVIAFFAKLKLYGF